MRVVMVHPSLPDAEIEVPEAAVFGHRSAGWITKEEADATAESETAPPAAAPTPAPSTPAATSRRPSPISRQDEE